HSICRADRLPDGGGVRVRRIPEGDARMAGKAAPDSGKGKEQYHPGEGSGAAKGTDSPPGHRPRTTGAGDPKAAQAGASGREGVHHGRVREKIRREAGGEVMAKRIMLGIVGAGIGSLAGLV